MSREQIRKISDGTFSNCTVTIRKVSNLRLRKLIAVKLLSVNLHGIFSAKLILLAVFASGYSCDEHVNLDPKSRVSSTTTVGTSTGGTTSTTDSPTSTVNGLTTTTFSLTSSSSSPTTASSTSTAPTVTTIPTGTTTTPTGVSSSIDEADETGDGLVLGTTYDVDSDLDGLRDSEEAELLTNPDIPDTDGDGFIDGYETTAGSDPIDPSSIPGVTGKSLSQPVCQKDSDADYISDDYEIELGSDPFSPDTDGDGIPDGTELLNHTDLLDATSRSADSDGDGIYDTVEGEYGTNALSADSDKDGLSDSHELLVNLDPIIPDSLGDGMLDRYHYCPDTQSASKDLTIKFSN